MWPKKTTLIFFIPAAALMFILSLSTVTDTWDLNLYDFFLTQRIALFPKPLNPRIIHIDLNDSSDNELTEDIDSRKAFADVIEILGELGISAAFDFIWQRPGPNDAAMARAARSAYSMIFAAAPAPQDLANSAFDNMNEEDLAILSGNIWHVREYGRGSIPLARSFILSNPEISASASSLGHIGVENDSDRVYRRMPLFYRWEDGLIPCLALAMAADELMIDPADMELYHGKELVLPIPGEKPIRIPIDEKGQIIIPYTSLWEDSGTRLSFSRIAGALYDDDLYMELLYSISGQTALVADTTTAKNDFGISPMERVYPLSGIHSSIFSAILDEEFYYPLRPVYKILIMIFLFLAAAAIYMLKKDGFYHGAFFLLGFLFISAITILWFKGRIIPWISLPAAFLLSVWALGFVNRLFMNYRERYQLELTFSRYLSPELVKTVTSDPNALKLGGQKKIMTALFTDLKDFSALSETIDDPEKLTTLLNFYLSGMSDIILDNRGTIDKYEGDAIISFFGAPVDLENHAELACRSAVLMKRQEIILNSEIEKRRLSPRPLFTRIGINTGEMVVGNMGTVKKMDYTIMGASVNLASRLEGVNKQYFTGICISDQTKKAAGSSFVCRRLDRVRVIGINVPVQLWELLDIREEAAPALLEMTEEWENAIAEYEKRNYSKAEALFHSLSLKNPNDKCAFLFEVRCAEYLNAPPPDDGVINMTSK